MNIESQVTSFELSKQLKELGVKQDSLFYWVETKTNPIWVIAHNHEYHEKSFNLDSPERNEQRVNSKGCDCCSGDWEIINKYSALTVAELLELLPLVNGCPLQLLKGCRIEFGILYAARYDSLEMHYSSMDMLPDKNPSNALAKMLIYLYEDGWKK